MPESENGKNAHLWKNLKTLKNKYQPLDIQYPYSKKEGSSIEDALNSVAQRKKPEDYSQIREAIQSANQTERQQMEEKVEKSDVEDYIIDDTSMIAKNKQAQQKMRKDSIVQEIIDIDALENQFNNAQEFFQQPKMIMSMTYSPTVIPTRNKLRHFRDSVQRVKNVHLDFRIFVENEHEKMLEFMKATIGSIISCITRAKKRDESQLTPSFGSNEYEYESLKKKIEKLQQELKIEKENSFSMTEQSNRFTFAITSPIFPNLPLTSLSKTMSDQPDHELPALDIEEKIKLIHKLRQENKKFHEDNENLNEIIFDLQQKIAQIDLEVDKKVEEKVNQKLAQLNKQPNQILQKVNSVQTFNRETPENQFDRELLLLQISNLQKQIQILSNKCLKNDELMTFREENISSKQKQLTQMEKQLQQILQQFRMKNFELELKDENIKNKQLSLKNQQDQLKNKEIELFEREQKLMKGDNLMKNRRFYENNSSDHVFEYTTRTNEQGVDNQIGRNFNVKPSLSHYKKMSKVGDLNFKFDQNSPAKNQRSRSRSESKNKHKLLKSNPIIKPSSHFNKPIAQNYAASKASSQDQNRFQVLDSKIERLRLEIRKEIQDVA